MELLFWVNFGFSLENGEEENAARTKDTERLLRRDI